MYLVTFLILSQSGSDLGAVGRSALPVALEHPLPPAPAELVAPMSCPVFWTFFPDGTAEGGVSSECPASLREDVTAAMVQWTFAPPSEPATASTTLQATFYLYNPSAPMWTVAGPGDLRLIHWSEAKVKRRMVPVMPEAAREVGDSWCSVNISIDEKGRVFDVRVIECPELFQENTLKAAYDSAYYPVKGPGGQPIPVEFVMKYMFKVAN